MVRYLVECFGDGACARYASDWPDVVKTVANMMYYDPSPDNEIEVAEMLRDGHEDQQGWDGEYVRCDFEDGAIEVHLFPTTTETQSEGIAKAEGSAQ